MRTAPTCAVSRGPRHVESFMNRWRGIRGEKSRALTLRGERLGIRMNKSLSVNKTLHTGTRAKEKRPPNALRHANDATGHLVRRGMVRTRTHRFMTLSHTISPTLSFSSNCSTRLSFRVSPSRFAPFVSFSRHVPTSSALLLCLPPFWSHCVAAFIVLLLSLSLYIHHTRVL